MKKLSIFIILIIAAGFLLTGSTEKLSDVEKIKAAMEFQRQAWNKTDLDGYMSVYWKSPELLFQGGKGRMKGWETVYAMYKKNYAGEKMGQLDFSEIVVTPISNDHAYVIGHWKVTTKDTVKEGEFTLIFKRFGQDWKIILDHSS